MPDFFDVLRTRRTVRSYTTEPVADGDLRELIDSAILAPTGMNLQPWAFSVVTNRGVMDQLNAIVVGILRSPEARERMGERMKEIVNAPGYNIFYGAPALVVISGDTSVPGAIGVSAAIRSPSTYVPFVEPRSTSTHTPSRRCSLA